MVRKARHWVVILALGCSLFHGPETSSAQQHVVLTFDSAVNIAMENSYRIKQLQLGIERKSVRIRRGHVPRRGPLLRLGVT